MERLEGLAKLTGRERYVDDLPLPGALWGATVRSPAPRGRIRRVRFGEAVDWSQFVVVDHRDVPVNEVLLIERDQPVLAAERVRHLHEPVVLLAHPSRDAVRRAAAAVTVEVDSEPPVLDFTRAPRPGDVQYGDDDVLKRLLIEKGDVEAALASAANVVEGVYRTGAQEHVYLETQGMAAWVDEQGLLSIEGSLQCPFYVLKAVAHALDRPAGAIRIVQAPTGGGFGGKEEYPSVVALHAALLALAAGRPVKLVYDRGEDMEATTKRHPARVRHRTGVDAGGRLVAQDIEVVLDGGAYVTLSPVVLSRGIIHAAGPYACDNVRIRGRAMFTNSPPYGAFRGFGAPQTHFANERHMDVVAAAVGLDAIELRRRNLIADGETTATGQVIADGTDRVALLDRAVELSGWREKEPAHVELARSHPYLRRGMGLACFHHGAGFTGGGEVTLASRVEVAGLADGGVEVRTANIEMGQGTLTVFTQIAAGRTGLDPAAIVIARADTARVPDSGPTVASRTTMVVGGLVERACDALVERLEGARGPALAEAIRAAAAGGEPPIAEAVYEPPPGIRWDDSAYRGDAYAAYGWATYVAEVEVDLRTWSARVVDFVALQEVGRILNEPLARGQVQGGVVQAIGWALMEEVALEGGAMANPALTNYVIPTSDDVPPIRVAFEENPYPHGAGGAKGLGELPIDGPAPAVVNAVARALGIAVSEIPLTPERLMAAVDAAGAADAA